MLVDLPICIYLSGVSYVPVCVCCALVSAGAHLCNVGIVVVVVVVAVGYLFMPHDDPYDDGPLFECVKIYEYICAFHVLSVVYERVMIFNARARMAFFTRPSCECICVCMDI